MRGHVRERGAGNWYAVLSVRDQATGKRKTVWKSLPGCKGKREAEAECRKLVGQIDTGDFVMNDNATVAQWAEHWISIGCPGKKRKAVSNRTKERYAEILRNYILPTLGARQLQKLAATEIDKLYTELAKRLKPLTLFNTHIVFASCVGTAVRQRKIQRNPVLDLAKVPAAGEADHGMVLDKDELAAFVKGCRNLGTSLFPIVTTLAWTGMRRGECLALRWDDFDAKAKTLSITRAVEETKAGLAIKGPKKAAHARTIAISDDLVALLLAERDRLLRVVAGVPEGVAVDLRLVKLPEGALIFPAQLGAWTALRSPRTVSSLSRYIAGKLGHPKLRLHDLRGSHETCLLDAGVPVHVVAKRCGHDAAVLLRVYAKRTKKADQSAAAAIGALSAGVLG